MIILAMGASQKACLLPQTVPGRHNGFEAILGLLCLRSNCSEDVGNTDGLLTAPHNVVRAVEESTAAQV